MIDIIGKKKILYVISGALFAAGVLSLVVFGLKPGIDFTGGSLLELTFPKNRPTVTEVQDMIKPLNLGTVITQLTGTDGMIMRMPFVTEANHQKILATIRDGVRDDSVLTQATSTAKLNTTSTVIVTDTSSPDVIEKRFATVGSVISSQLKQRALTASVVIILVIVAFVAYAFRRVTRPVKSWKYGVAAVVAMLHDVVITAGVFALLGHFKGIEVDIPFLVAMLTVFGYSVNDTIVVFDRIRENLIRKSSENFEKTVNAAVNETMARSINSSMTTLIVMAALFLLGGDSIRYFALALLIGIFLGTYSSIFVASSMLVSWYNFDRKKAA